MSGAGAIVAILKTVKPAVPETQPNEGAHAFKIIITICAAVMFVAVLWASYGLDLSYGFF